MAVPRLYVGLAMTYATIDKRSQRASQIGFIPLLNRGLASYQLEAPTLWDVDFRTAVAQPSSRIVRREGAYHRLRFDGIPTAGRWKSKRPVPSCCRPGGARSRIR